MLNSFLFSLVLLPLVYGWTTQPFRVKHTLVPPNVLKAAADDDDAPDPVEMDSNPCWQDIYSYDCAMSNVYAANFVASKWVMTMPCAAGVEDCDMPFEMTVPENRPEAGVDNVDVMNVLGLKRAAPVSKGKKDNSDDDGVAP